MARGEHAELCIFAPEELREALRANLGVKLIACCRLFLPIRLVFHAEFKSAASVSDAEDCAADFLWFARTGTFLFQTDEDRLRFCRVELQDDPAFIGCPRLGGQLAVERCELAVGRVHV
jgi:hypothetical protein